MNPEDHKPCRMPKVGDKLFFHDTLEVARVTKATGNIRLTKLHTDEHYPHYQCWDFELREMLKKGICTLINC